MAQQERISITHVVVLAACAAWIAWQTWAIMFEGGDGNGILLLPAVVLVVHMGGILTSGNRPALRLDALCLGLLFLAGTVRDVTRITAYDLGSEAWSLVWVELSVGVLLLLVWRWTR
jgi:hypothetical protein